MSYEELPDDALVTLTVAQIKYLCKQHFIDDIEQRGPIAKAIEQTYGLTRRS